MTSPQNKSDYFAISSELSLPAHCPLLSRCERRAHTIAIANKWPFEKAAERVGLKNPIIETVGQEAYLIGGANNFLVNGQCPEVNLFETSWALPGISEKPTIKGQYDKYMDPQFQILETGHYSQCAEYSSAVWERSQTANTRLPIEQRQPTEKSPKYQVALSFAGEDRDYVQAVASLLREAGISVFYDRYEESTLWGKNLYDHLRHIYKEASEYTVMFISTAYAQKLWTNHERESAQERAFEERQEYILPVRFDDTILPSLSRNIGYIDLRDKSPEDLTDLIIQKLRQNPDINIFN